MYSSLANKRKAWNNSIGWTIVTKLINVGYGINILGGIFKRKKNIVGFEKVAKRLKNDRKI